MDDVVAEVAERAGVSEEVAQKAVEAVIEVLNDRLPEPYGGHVEAIIDGSFDMDDLTKGLGSLLGG